jgi:hypothetical protein
MTLEAARRSGFSEPTRWVIGWRSHCPTCDACGPRRDYKGEASTDARKHNKEHHES